MGSDETRSDGFKREGENLFRNVSSGRYYAFFKHQGKQIKRSLKTDNRTQAKRNLADLINKYSRVNLKTGRVTLEALCDEYMETLSQAPKTMEEKRGVVARIKADWPGPGGGQCQIAKIRPADVRKWLASYDFGASAYNSYLWFIRKLFDYALENRLVMENPARDIKAKKRESPIRPTPTSEQFQAIGASIRSQVHHARSCESADFVEFMGLAGVGNAEAINLKWGDIDFGQGTITLFREKTRTGYQIPIFPQLRPLLEARRGEQDRSPSEPVFTIRSAKKALQAACDRLNLRHFDHRSLRRMFVTRALQKGVDVKTVSAWQGHKDGGKLILSTYSHVLNDHSAKMAALMVSDESRVHV